MQWQNSGACLVTKKRTVAQKKQDYYDAYKCIKEGRTVKRSIAKDGSVATHSVVPVSPGQPEKIVLNECIEWLRTRGVIADRNNTGFGDIGGTGAMYRYGIVDGGDIIGVLRNGIHLEIECKKSNGGRLSVGQQKRMEKVRENNGLYYVVHGVSELEFYLEGEL